MGGPTVRVTLYPLSLIRLTISPWWREAISTWFTARILSPTCSRPHRSAGDPERRTSSVNKSVQDQWSLVSTWYYSADGGAGPANTGDDDKPEALVLEPGHGHVVRVDAGPRPRLAHPIPVTLCNINKHSDHVR